MLPNLFYAPVKRDLLKLTGRDRASFLQGMVSNDVMRLQTGEGCYAFMLDATGHVLADMRVLNIGDYLLLDLEPGMASFVAETLDKYLIMEKCRITDVTDSFGCLIIGGEGAANELDIDNPQMWSEGSNRLAQPHGEDTIIVALPPMGVPLYEFFFTNPDNTGVAYIPRNEDGSAVDELSLATLEALRIDAGIPRMGIDMDKAVLAPETGQSDRAISFRKGCYIGQEIIARIDARGRTNRGLTRFQLNTNPVRLPDHNTQVFVEDKSVGRITSAAISPASDLPIALGYLRNEYAQPGRVVALGAEDGDSAHVR